MPLVLIPVATEGPCAAVLAFLAPPLRPAWLPREQLPRAASSAPGVWLQSEHGPLRGLPWSGRTLATSRSPWLMFGRSRCWPKGQRLRGRPKPWARARARQRRRGARIRCLTLAWARSRRRAPWIRAPLLAAAARQRGFPARRQQPHAASGPVSTRAPGFGLETPPPPHASSRLRWSLLKQGLAPGREVPPPRAPPPGADTRGSLGRGRRCVSPLRGAALRQVASELRSHLPGDPGPG